jgi:transcription antitermination factor NusG
MQKNWYIVYTKPKCEKKVALLFTKRKIEHFLPVNCRQLHSIRKRKIVSEPLFDSYIFAFFSEEDISKIKKVEGVLNLVYWKGKPATIQKNEIEAIKEFTSDHLDIKLEKTRIDLNGLARVVDGPQYLMERNILTIKNKMVKVNLPSLGFTMIAEISSANLFNDKISFENKELLFQS